MLFCAKVIAAAAQKRRVAAAQVVVKRGLGQFIVPVRFAGHGGVDHGNGDLIIIGLELICGICIVLSVHAQLLAKLRDLISDPVERGERILSLGHSIHAAESVFCDMVRNNRKAEITLIDRDIDTVCRNLCNTLQLSLNRYTTLTVQNHPARKYDNRITVVQADLNDIDLSPWLENQGENQG